VERVIDCQVIGEHVCLTDIDGRTYLVALSEVRYLAPSGFTGARVMPKPLQVVA